MRGVILFEKSNQQMVYVEVEVTKTFRTKLNPADSYFNYSIVLGQVVFRISGFQKEYQRMCHFNLFIHLESYVE